MLVTVKTNNGNTIQIEVPDFDPLELTEIVLHRDEKDIEYHVLRKIPLSSGPTINGTFLLNWVQNQNTAYRRYR